MKRSIILLSAAAVILSVLVSCESLGDIGYFGAQIAAESGYISQNQADAISSAAESAEKAFEQLTPEQEYYIGRSVAANILMDYKALDDPAALDYLNTLGQALAMASDKPYTYKGYHFMLLDSEEINAFATPGGFIFITLGMLRCTDSEATLAAVLAHEINHVVLNHGIKAIKSSRWTDTITKTALAGVALSSEEMGEVTASFGDSVNDITKTLVVSGYSKKQEKEADQGAAVLLARVGYDPEALITMLNEMDKRWDPSGGGFAKTHPSPKERIKNVSKTIKVLPVPYEKTTPVRVNRYHRAFDSIL